MKSYCVSTSGAILNVLSSFTQKANVSSIARRIGFQDRTVRSHLALLEETGVYNGFVADLRPGVGYHESLKVYPAGTTAEDLVDICSRPEVIEIIKSGGKYYVRSIEKSPPAGEKVEIVLRRGCGFFLKNSQGK